MSTRSGHDGTELRRLRGGRAGQAFGVSIQALGDLTGDGSIDFLVRSARYSKDDLALISGASGTVHVRLSWEFGLVSPVGDLDGDCAVDYCASGDADLVFGPPMQFHSGRSGELLFDLPTPAWASAYAVAAGVGDLDQDGYEDFLVGDADVGIEVDEESIPIDVRAMTVSEVLALQPDGRSGGWQNGCALVFSGRTREILMGVFGLPEVFDGLGLQVLGLPGVNSDGVRDFLVADVTSAWIFAGPDASAR